MLLCALMLLGAPDLHNLIGRAVALMGMTGSLLLHELAHCFVAQKYQVQVPLILLTPLGRGISADLFEKELPGKGEARIAAAGPLVSIALGSLLSILTYALNLNPLFMWLAGANLVVGILNLIPAFPLDGGFILRGTLRQWLTLVQATRWTNICGRMIAIACVGGGFFFMELWWLGFLGIFILLSGRSEELSARFRTLVKGRTAADVMQETVKVLPAALPVTQALEEAKRTTQSLFPVCFGSKPLGLVSLEELESLVKAGLGEQGLSTRMSREFLLSAEDEPLSTLLQRMAHGQVPRAVVMNQGEPVGVVGLEQVLAETPA